MERLDSMGRRNGSFRAEVTSRRTKTVRERYPNWGDFNIGRKRPDLSLRNTVEIRKGNLHPLFGKKHSEITKSKISETRLRRGVARGEKHPRYIKGIERDIIIDLYINKKLNSREISKLLNQDRQVILNRIKQYNIPQRNISEAHVLAMEKSPNNRNFLRDRLKNPDNLKSLLKSIVKKPNRPETALIRIFTEHNLPYKYVGDGDFILEGRCPDFLGVNGNKKVIELFGDYWHNPKLRKNLDYRRTEKGTIEHYNKYGFKCLIIWEHELKNLNQVVDRIKQFEVD